MKIRTAIYAGGLSLGLAAAALAHGGATGVVKERMDAMVVLKDASKALAAMMRGQTEYDPETVRQAAAQIGAHAGAAMTRLFPEGSTQMPSEALPQIWQDWDAFEALAQELAATAGALGLAADNGLAADGGSGGAAMMGGTAMMGGAAKAPAAEELAKMPADQVFKRVAETCSACHARFRAE